MSSAAGEEQVSRAYLPAGPGLGWVLKDSIPAEVDLYQQIGTGRIETGESAFQAKREKA